MIIGIDTSNYTTSVAAVESGGIVSDHRRLLAVKDGERGLRQQEALFQHVNNLPELYREVMDDIEHAHISAVAVSVRPRPVEGSYMPVFNAGKSFADVIAAALDVPLYEFSHQDGHVAAAAKDTELEDSEDFVFFHLSGGTTEAVSLPDYELCGKTLDISFGQLIDRAGVAMGMHFPCGRKMDEMALAHAESVSETGKYSLPRIKVSDGEVNLSGIESACQRIIGSEADNGDFDRETFCRELFDVIADTLWRMTLSIRDKTGKDSFLFAGGVSSSVYIRKKLETLLGGSKERITICFGKPELCRDNSVGIALLGEKRYGA